MTMRTTRAVFLAASALLGAMALEAGSGFNTASAAQCPGYTVLIDGHQVITTRNATTGNVTREEWQKDGVFDRANGPAVIEHDAATGQVVTYGGWYKGGKLDRADGPAIIEHDAATGTLTREEWWKDGKKFEPAADVRAAWLQKSGERIAPPAVAKPVPAPG